MTDMVIPDAIVPVEGWRVWRLHNGSLKSLHTHHTWTERTAERAACNRRAYTTPRFPGVEYFGPAHEAPHETCACGLYAAKEEELALRMASQFYAQAIGIVALWGKVIEYDKGYRAEFAYPVRIWVTRETNEATRLHVEKAYGVPVERGGKGMFA